MRDNTNSAPVQAKQTENIFLLCDTRTIVLLLFLLAKKCSLWPGGFMCIRVHSLIGTCLVHLLNVKLLYLHFADSFYSFFGYKVWKFALSRYMFNVYDISANKELAGESQMILIRYQRGKMIIVIDCARYLILNIFRLRSTGSLSSFSHDLTLTRDRCVFYLDTKVEFTSFLNQNCGLASKVLNLFGAIPI